MHEASGKIYDTDQLTNVDAARLVPIPAAHEGAVRSMNRVQRRAWASAMRTTGIPSKAFEAARKKGWHDSQAQGA